MADQERLGSSSVEQLKVSPEQAKEQRERVREKLEREQNPNRQAEQMESAKSDIEKQFQNEKKNTVRQPKQISSARTPIKKATKQAKEAEYKKTMKTIQKDMSPASRTFSKVIHNPVVEATSEVAGKTVARPAALLAGSLSALILVSIVYAVAKYFGYVLSGAEWIAAFIIGWAIGLIVDWVRVALLGHRAGPA